MLVPFCYLNKVKIHLGVSFPEAVYCLDSFMRCSLSSDCPRASPAGESGVRLETPWAGGGLRDGDGDSSVRCPCHEGSTHCF